MSFQSLSRQFDATRQEIVANYRVRINQQKRTKLTKLELEELIDIFITRLETFDDRQDIQQLCASEIALFEEGYPVATIAKNQIPSYRQAIATAVREGRIKLTEQNSHSYTYFKDGVEQITCEHWAITYLKYEIATYEEINTATTSNNNLKQDSLQPVNLPLYLETVDSLLHSSQSLDLAIAIAATSGRRYSEVMARGKFTMGDHPYRVRFSGQLKKRERELTDEDYLSYTLLPASKVLNALERFRNHPDIAAMSEASIEEINSLNTPLNRLIKQHFQDTAIVPLLTKEEGVTVQNLRSIYGEIAVHFFCPPSVATHRFIQQKLGHIISESALATRKNSSSTEHYFHYYLIDDRGKHLADKGVLLESSPLVRQQNYHPVEFPLNMSYAKRLCHGTSFASSEGVPKGISRSRLTGHFDIPFRDPLGLPQPAFSNNSSTPAISIHQDRPDMNQPTNQPDNSIVSNTIHAIPPYLHSRLSDLAHSLNLSPAEAIEKSFQWAEMGIALASELELESINPHAVFERVQALGRQQISNDGSNSNLNSSELIAAREQIATLTRSLDRITELFYQAQAKSNSNSTQEHQTSTVPASATPPSTSARKHSLESVINSSQPKTEKKTENITQHSSSHKSNHTQRKRDSSSTVREDVNHAIDAIIEFNNFPHRPQEQKFYIGVGSVRELTGRGDTAIKPVLEQRQQEIQQHLQQHQLDQNHNLSRRDSNGNEYPTIDIEPELPYQKITQVSTD